jgi:hypothetical protein
MCPNVSADNLTVAISGDRFGYLQDDLKAI